MATAVRWRQFQDGRHHCPLTPRRCRCRRCLRPLHRGSSPLVGGSVSGALSTVAGQLVVVWCFLRAAPPPASGAWALACDRHLAPGGNGCIFAPLHCPGRRIVGQCCVRAVRPCQELTRWWTTAGTRGFVWVCVGRLCSLLPIRLVSRPIPARDLLMGTFDWPGSRTIPACAGTRPKDRTH